MMDLLAFPDQSRVWIYAADQEIPDEQIPDIFYDIQQFTKNWISHQIDLRATGGILHNRFVVLLVDEFINKPGGCSIDKSVKFIQDLEQKYKVNFFNRELQYYFDNDQVIQIHLNKITEAFQLGQINNETLFFDNLVSTKKDFIELWIRPLNMSWLRRFAG